MHYDFKLHIHNFAIWAAARAVNRSFAKTSAIKYAIEEAKLNELIGKSSSWNQDAFDDWHRSKANEIIEHLVKFDPLLKSKATYGRAAMVIAIYLKTAVILPQVGENNLCKIIHAPMPKMVLDNLYEDRLLPTIDKVNWTLLDETEYWRIIDYLRAKGVNPNWKLERYWSV